ncbi:hypothetical protein [Salinispora oceanensis]|uniref:hypothetical protein n=1 Tax=Salinispora oceanensis TaxID=1050199 RepID=UPI001CC4EE05|nr:hypothetical protein [Salinispora oceanensis]
MRHTHRVFHNPPPATSADVRAAVDGGELVSALDAMVGAALYGDGDWKELQDLYLELLNHESCQVKALAATCLGHLARVYGQLDETRVVAALRHVRSVPNVGGAAVVALEDIELFLHPRRSRWRGRLWRALRPWTWI